jgi:hypothetical protein
MNDDDYIVFIVVDDVLIREALSGLPASHSIPAVACGTGGVFAGRLRIAEKLRMQVTHSRRAVE